MQILREFLRTAEQRPFRYGRHDCCTVAAGWIVRMGGRDVLANRRYGSMREGLSIAHAEGHDNHLPWLAEACDRIAPLAARAGDLAVCVEGHGLPAVGIVRPGGEDALFVGPSGPRVAVITVADYCLRVR